MKKTGKKQLLFAFVVLLLLGYMTWLLVTREQRQVKHVIESIKVSVETENLSGCLGWLSSTYHDERGYSPDDIRQILSQVFHSLDDINVTIINQKVMIKDQEALALVTFKVVGTVQSGMRGYVAGNLNQPARISVHLKKTDTLWQIDRVNQVEAGI